MPAETATPAPVEKLGGESAPQPAAEAVATEPAKPAAAIEAPTPQAEKPATTEAPAEQAKVEAPPVAKSSNAPVIPPRGNGTYAVALGTFGNPDNVVRMLAAAEKLNVTTYTETTPNGLTRVRAGPFASKAEARKVLKALKAAGMAGVLDKR
jgi:DedD protein